MVAFDTPGPVGIGGGVAKDGEMVELGVAVEASLALFDAVDLVLHAHDA